LGGVATKSKETLWLLTKKGLENNFLHIFFLRTAGLFSACRSSCERAGQKRTEVLKKIIANLMAAITLIAVENISALRVLLKNIVDFASKSVRLHRKL